MALLVASTLALVAGPALAQGSLAGPDALLVSRVKLRADTSPPVDRGSLRVDASVSLPSAILAADVAASGLTMRVRTAAGVDVTLTWAAGDCQLRAIATGAIVECIRSQAGGARRARLRPRTAGRYDLTMIARGLALAAPLSADPVRVTLTTASLTREDAIDVCELRGANGRIESCRQTTADPSPSSTPTASVASTPTRTRTQTPTVTTTGTITSTFTVTRTHTVTPTPTVSRTPTITRTPTPFVASGPLGVRVYTIDTLQPTGLYTTTGRFGFVGDLTLAIAAGQPDGAGLASLSLVEDASVVMGIGRPTFQNTYMCFRLLAAGSSGNVDCDGGTAFDIEASQPTGPAGTALALHTGLGDPAGPGNAVLLIQAQRSAPIEEPDFFPGGCDTAVYEAPQLVALTTTNGTAVKGAHTLTRTGAPFDCGTWSTVDTGGQLVMPLPEYILPIPGQPHRGDQALVATLAEDGNGARTSVCSFAAGSTGSRLEVTTASGPALIVPLAGALEMHSVWRTFTERDLSGRCQMLPLDPTVIPGVGVLCGEPSIAACDSAYLDCDGDLAGGIDIVTDTDIGPCDGTLDCAAQCQNHCFLRGGVARGGGCTGWCAVPSCTCPPSQPCACTEFSCSSDAQCQRPPTDSSRALPWTVPADTCSGPEPVDQIGACQCTCVSSPAASPRPGQTTCSFGAALWIESSAPCDRSDTMVDFGVSCARLTSGLSRAALLDADGGGAAIPASGLSEQVGEPLSCNRFSAGDTSGLMLRGTLHALDSSLGDAALDLFIDCE